MITLGPVKIVKLGQADDVRARAEKAVLLYDEALKKAALVADDAARGEILAWVGRADLPGSPAERYSMVRQDLAENTYSTEIGQNRIRQLEDDAKSLQDKVTNALETYGSLPAPGRAGSETEAVSTVTWCLLGGVALLGLVILPLLSD